MCSGDRIELSASNVTLSDNDVRLFGVNKLQTFDDDCFGFSTMDSAVVFGSNDGCLFRAVDLSVAIGLPFSDGLTTQ